MASPSSPELEVYIKGHILNKNNNNDCSGHMLFSRKTSPYRRNIPTIELDKQAASAIQAETYILAASPHQKSESPPPLAPASANKGSHHLQIKRVDSKTEALRTSPFGYSTRKQPARHLNFKQQRMRSANPSRNKSSRNNQINLSSTTSALLSGSNLLKNIKNHRKLSVCSRQKREKGSAQTTKAFAKGIMGANGYMSPIKINKRLTAGSINLLTQNNDDFCESNQPEPRYLEIFVDGKGTFQHRNKIVVSTTTAVTTHTTANNSGLYPARLRAYTEVMAESPARSPQTHAKSPPTKKQQQAQPQTKSSFHDNTYNHQSAFQTFTDSIFAPRGSHAVVVRSYLNSTNTTLNCPRKDLVSMKQVVSIEPQSIIRTQPSSHNTNQGHNWVLGKSSNTAVSGKRKMHKRNKSHSSHENDLVIKQISIEVGDLASAQAQQKRKELNMQKLEKQIRNLQKSRQANNSNSYTNTQYILEQQARIAEEMAKRRVQSGKPKQKQTQEKPRYNHFIKGEITPWGQQQDEQSHPDLFRNSHYK